MATPIQVSRVKRNGDRIVRLGGTWRDRPWSMSAENMVREIERPEGERQWDFFVVVTIDGGQVPVITETWNGRKVLTTPQGDAALWTS
jgi:hypothetical protein